MAEGSPAPASRGRKPVPTYYYAIGAAGIAVVYFLYSRNKAAKATASASATPSPDATAVAPAGAGSYGNANDLSALLPYLQAQGNATAAPAPTAGVASTSGPQVGAFSGSGFLPFGKTAADIGGNPGTITAADANGNNFLWITSAEGEALPKGTQWFYEPIPGVFTDKIDWTKLGRNTPIYVRATQ